MRVPLRTRAARGRDVSVADVAGKVPREVDAVRLHAEADEARHRDAAVLNLGMAVPANSRLLRVGNVRGQADRVPEANGRVKLASQVLQIRNGLHVHLNTGRTHRRSRNDGRKASDSGGDTEHDCEWKGDDG